MPGKVSDGLTVLARHCLLVVEEERTVAFVDLEVYDDGTASLAIVVAPSVRGKGMARRVLSSLWSRPELDDVHHLFGGVSPDNVASLCCLKAAGFTIAVEADAEGMLSVSMVRPTVRD
jgi:RimJ/RimL family protein N-acetyltransferase